ncbi:hypothetical protein GCM10011349_35670 [Novosphingobium indicum]|uniref:Uncharacterized protein n=1 Tax=Novosphingobium indicum TaxID=462949 RepID=A0ABQ2JUP8_9SPHN|nr:hypothetical protein GCM10011349_35670 [Novosphingobium indicum]
MPETQNENRSLRNFVAYFVIANDDSPYLARIEGIQPLAEARVVQQPTRRTGQFLDNARRGIGREWFQMFMKANKVRRSLAGPLDFHAKGGASGSFVERLSAQATML